MGPHVSAYRGSDISQWEEGGQGKAVGLLLVLVYEGALSQVPQVNAALPGASHHDVRLRAGEACARGLSSRLQDEGRAAGAVQVPDHVQTLQPETHTDRQIDRARESDESE